MKQYVIDTSVFMKLFLEEIDSEKAVRFFVHANNNNHVLLIPALFQSEFLSVIKSTGIHFEDAYGLLEEYLASNLKQVDYSKAMMVKALEIASHSNHNSGHPSVYDSIYHALAMLYDCDYITSDTRHYEKTQELGHIKLLAEL